MDKPIEIFEHQSIKVDFSDKQTSDFDLSSIYFRKNNERVCLNVLRVGKHYQLEGKYYIGADWVSKHQHLEIIPKLDQKYKSTDFLKMLSSAFLHPGAQDSIDDLFEIKFHAPLISIKKENDYLSPLIVLLYLRILKDIARKGLRKGYYRVERNLNSMVKGKINVPASIKLNHVKGRILRNVCSFDEYGVNCPENRLLKKALLLSKSYLLSHKQQFPNIQLLLNDLSFVLNAFENVDSKIELFEIRSLRRNSFYKEYEGATRLSYFIIRRFGYNLNSTASDGLTLVPPYWIDMSKLFELYVAGLLYKRYGSDVKYQVGARGGGIVDFLICGESKIIVDAKYKLKYLDGAHLEDIRQISGYARTKSLLSKLGYSEEEFPTTVPKCLIIYPDQVNGMEEFKADFSSNFQEIHGFVKFYKCGIKLPVRGARNILSNVKVQH